MTFNRCHSPLMANRAPNRFGAGPFPSPINNTGQSGVVATPDCPAQFEQPEPIRKLWLEIANDLTVSHRTQISPRVDIDVVADKSRRSVAQKNVDPTCVLAACRELSSAANRCPTGWRPLKSLHATGANRYANLPTQNAS
ncbi:MAG: hypothetical protein JWP89_2906 [Schlesneria sp.]|nr:hypothetical protein [Schlesneria sp.]